MEDPETAKSVRNTSWPGLVPWPERSNADSALSRCAALSMLMGYPTCLHVTSANQLYRLSGEVLAFATANGILCSLENSARSHMWDTTYLQSAIGHLSLQLFKVQFHHCMFGGRRRKRTQLLVNHECFKHLHRPS